MRWRWGTAGSGLALLLAASVSAPSALATDYCVAPNTTCGGTNIATLQAALDQADNAPDADRVFLGAATYTAPVSTGYAYTTASAPVEIAGMGPQQTVLTAPAGASAVLAFFGGPTSVLRDLGIQIPMNAGPNPGTATGLFNGSLVQRVAITAHPTQSNGYIGALIEEGGRFEDGSVALPSPVGLTSTLGIGVSADDGEVSVARSRIAATTALSLHGTTAVERLDLTGREGLSAAPSTQDSVSTIRSSVVHVEPDGTGVSAFAQPAADIVLNAIGLTVIGSGSGFGAGANNIGFAQGATLNLSSSIVRGTERSIFRSADPGSGGASVNVAYSDYDPAAVENSQGPGTLSPPAGALEPGGNLNVDPLFVGAADFHLQAGSPLIDAGDPAAGAGLDFDGSPLPVDGDGDGVARRDIGAFERGAAPVADLRAPIASNFRASPRRFATRRVRRKRSARRSARVPLGTNFRYRLDEAARATIVVSQRLTGRRRGGRCMKANRRNRRGRRCTRLVRRGQLRTQGSLGNNRLRFKGKLRGRKLRPGSYRASLTAVDEAGNASKPVRAAFRVVRP